MRYQLPLVVGLLAVSWTLETFRRRHERHRQRARGPARLEDAGSRRVLTLTQLPPFLLGLAVAYGVPALDLPEPWRPAALAGGLSLACLGIGLRWWAMLTLGPFFVATVSIQADHRLVRVGPYRLLCHPAYTGGSLMFAGLGLATANLGAFVLCAIVPVAGFVHRIRVEEAALRTALPDYAAYTRETRRLLPFIW